MTELLMYKDLVLHYMWLAVVYCGYLLLATWIVSAIDVCIGMLTKERTERLVGSQYAFRFPFWFSVIILRYPLSFIAVAFFSKDFQLTTPFKWLDTIDNDLRGDTGWKSEHLIGSNPEAYINQVRWLWRNGGNCFNYWTIGLDDATAPAWAFWSKTAIPLWGIRFLDLRFGWSPEGPKQGRRKFVFTVRGKTKP